MNDPELESLEINKAMQKRIKGEWCRYLSGLDLDHLAEKHPAIKEKLEELKFLISLHQ
jgi:hypothetical protein